MACGPLPGALQLVPIAELFAFMMYLRHAVPVEGAYHYVTDCAYVRESFLKGEAAMCNGWSAHCDVWREAFRIINDIGYSLIYVHKTKAHRKLGSASTNLENHCIV
eukprot:11497505-Karenia_brevis.AAC.1